MKRKPRGPVFRVGNAPGGNYVEKQLAAMAREGLEGGVVAGSVEHDDWCGLFKGRACDCDPDITFTHIRR